MQVNLAGSFLPVTGLFKWVRFPLAGFAKDNER
jgi:hypothetical protein